MSRKEIYCVNCGTKNSIKNKKCKNCKKKLKQRDWLFFHYIFDYAKDTAKDKLFDKIIEFVQNFILGNFYGAILIATAIFAIIQFATNANQSSSNFITVDHKLTINEQNEIGHENTENNIKEEKPKTEKEIATNPELDNTPSKKDECKDIKGVVRVKTCKTGYALNGNICTKETSTTPTSSLSCPDGYTLSGNKCISNNSKEPTETKKCEVPSVLPSPLVQGKYVYTIPQGDTCQLWQCKGEDVSGCDANIVEIPFNIKHSCEDGYSLIENKCHTTTTPNKDYTCKKGTLENGKCSYTEETSYTLECPKGYSYDSKCNICKEN